MHQRNNECMHQRHNVAYVSHGENFPLDGLLLPYDGEDTWIKSTKPKATRVFVDTREPRINDFLVRSCHELRSRDDIP